MYDIFSHVTGADPSWAARLKGFDPFLDDLSRAQVIDDAQEIRELMKVAAHERSVAFTFPSMPEVFHGTIMTRPGARQSGPPLVLVDVTAAGLNTTHWVKGIPVNFGFFDGTEYIGCRTSFAGSVGTIMALLGPRQLLRSSKPGRERRPVPRGAALMARFTLPGEGAKVCWLREMGRGAARGSIEPGPLVATPHALNVYLTLPDATSLQVPGRLVHIRLREDANRDVLLEFDPPTTEIGDRLEACVATEPRATPAVTPWSPT